MECRKPPEENNLFANELWINIFSFLSIRELALVSRVCWQLNQLANDDLLWLNKFPQVTHELVKQTQQPAKSLVKSYTAHQSSYGKFFNLPGNNYFRALMDKPTFKAEMDKQIEIAKPRGGMRKDYIGIMIGELEADKNSLVKQAYSESGLSMAGTYCLFTFDANNRLRRMELLSASTCVFIFNDSTQGVIKQMDTIRKFVNTLPMIFLVSNNKEIASTISRSNYPITEVITLHEFHNEGFWIMFAEKLRQLTNTPRDDYEDMAPSRPLLNTKCNMM